MGEERVCARRDCQETFFQKTHNQKYCTSECCRIETNSRIMEKYYEKRDQRLGKTRMCNVCGTTKLSRYNDLRICNGCQARRSEQRNQSAKDKIRSLLVGS